MEMTAGVVLLDLRLCDIAIRETAKIAAKRQEDPLKCRTLLKIHLSEPQKKNLTGHSLALQKNRTSEQQEERKPWYKIW